MDASNWILNYPPYYDNVLTDYIFEHKLSIVHADDTVTEEYASSAMGESSGSRTICLDTDDVKLILYLNTVLYIPSSDISFGYPLAYGTCMGDNIDLSEKYIYFLKTNDTKVGHYVFAIDDAVVASGGYMQESWTIEIDLPFAPVQQTTDCADENRRRRILSVPRRKAIANGHAIEDARAYPFMLALRKGDVNLFNTCGASLVSPRHVMTASHCFGGAYSGCHGWPYGSSILCSDACDASDGICDDPRGTKKCHAGTDCTDCGEWHQRHNCYESPQNVLAGTLRTDLPGACAETLPFDSADGHPDYTFAENSDYFIRHDLAILTLSIRSAYAPVALYTGTSESLLNATVRVMGWGLDEDQSSSNTLRSVLGVVQCVGMLCVNDDSTWCYTHQFASDDNLCVRYGVDNTGGACQGDSGGPVILVDETTSESVAQVGVVSFMLGSCGDGTARYLAMNTAYAAHFEWISQKIGE